MRPLAPPRKMEAIQQFPELFPLCEGAKLRELLYARQDACGPDLIREGLEASAMMVKRCHLWVQKSSMLSVTLVLLQVGFVLLFICALSVYLLGFLCFIASRSHKSIQLQPIAGAVRN
jgi:hypothetical protein